MGIFSKVFGSYSTRELARIEPLKKKVLELDEEYQALSDADLKEKTNEFRERLEDGESLESMEAEALATVREAAYRVLGKKPFPVQIIGAIVLHQGRIAEMKTGEGKTLVACVAAYLNALTGKGVHVVTVNDYLAKTQSDEMGKVLRYLGLTVGCILHGLTNDQRRAAYNCDVTYGTNNELGFDYLRDNMVIYKKDKVQREHNFAIVDEVDSILIDEARTPLIISGKGDKSTALYGVVDKFAKTLTAATVVEMDDKQDQEEVNENADYIVDEKSKTATITRRGVKKAEEYFAVENLMDPENMTLLHHVNQALKANGVMRKDIDYIVEDGEVVIIDEFTGRKMLGRRFNDGLHQAIEAKEGVEVAQESKTLATITFQNYFRLYTKLSGMTGTAMTEEDEFREIYKLDVIAIPTNRPVQRIDHTDLIYRTEKGKYKAIIEQIAECHEKGQPVLVGTISIEKSELLSSMLKRKGIKHEVLTQSITQKKQRSLHRLVSWVQLPLPPIWLVVVRILCWAVMPNSSPKQKCGSGNIRKKSLQKQSAMQIQTIRKCWTQEPYIRNCTNSSAKKSRKRHRQSRRPAVCTFWVQNVTNPAVSITSCVVVPAVRVTRVKAASSCR
mgnify:CR=1 FL=1